MVSSQKNKSDSERSGYRPDIDGLRALAVLSVIVYHYQPQLLHGGFIGVDIFFVISGYLITGILHKTNSRGTFSLVDFYQRRILRIYPALLTILIFCLAFGWFFLFAGEYLLLGKYVAAGAGYIENIVLWLESGYFDADAIEKPLLHLWSLSVEEQFYIFWPLVLWFIMRRRWPVMASITLITLASFALNIWYISHHQVSSAFYLTGARAWELMAGAWLALAHQTNIALIQRRRELQSWCGLLLVLIGLIVIQPEDNFPGFWATLPVLGTVMIINAGMKAIPNRLLFSARPVVWVGLISYPLYLWHWILWSLPLMVWGSYLQDHHVEHRGAAFLVSIVLAWVTYRFFETPVRRRGGVKMAALLFIGVALTGIGGLVVYVKNGLPGMRSVEMNSQKEIKTYVDSLKMSPLKRQCYNLTRDNELKDDWYCEIGDTNADAWIMFYGDSHAAAMLSVLDAIGKRENIRIVASTMGICPALLETFQDDKRGAACAELAYRAARKVRQDKASAVIVFERWNSYFKSSIKYNYEKNISSYNNETRKPGKVVGEKAVLDGLRKTIAFYKEIEVPIIISTDTPYQIKKLPKEKLHNIKSEMENYLNETAITREQHKNGQRHARTKLRQIAADYSNVTLLHTDDALCDVEICPWSMSGRFLYVDHDHLSIFGAQLIYPALREAVLNRISY